MEAVMIHTSQNQQMSPYKSHMRTPMRMMNNSFISRPVENFFPSNIIHTGLLQTPNLFPTHSFPPYSFPQQPPPVISRGLSCPSINRNPNNSSRRARDSSLTPKKSKGFVKGSPRKDEIKSKKTTNTTRVAKPSPVSSTDSFGPDPKDVPKDVSKVLTSSINSNISSVGNIISVSSVKARPIEEGRRDQMDMFSGSGVYTISPPPSSLPLPTFSMRPKLSCNVQAAGIDAGATDDLRRLLRLV